MSDVFGGGGCGHCLVQSFGIEGVGGVSVITALAAVAAQLSLQAGDVEPGALAADQTVGEVEHVQQPRPEGAPAAAAEADDGELVAGLSTPLP